MIVIMEWDMMNPHYGQSLAHSRFLPTWEIPGRPWHPSIDPQWEARLEWSTSGQGRREASIRSPNLRPRPDWLLVMHSSTINWLAEHPGWPTHVRLGANPETP